MKRFIPIILFALFHSSTFSKRIRVRGEHNYRMIEPKGEISTRDESKIITSDCMYLICL